MLFSVVIPAHNRVQHLPHTLESVWQQRFTGFEVIVVDDGSTDGTLEYLHGVRDRIAVVQQAHEGPGAARNAGVARATGEYIAFLDSDDLWFPWTLEVVARAIREHRTPAIVTASVMQFEDERELAGVREEPFAAETYADLTASSRSTLLVGSGGVAVARRHLDASGGFSDRLTHGEDLDLMMRLGTAPGFVAITRPHTLGWRRHAGGLTLGLESSIAGSRYLIDQESRGAYPGGDSRALQRRELITRHVRPVSFNCLRQGRVAEAVSLYTATLGWHLKLRRWRYVGAFPAAAAWAAVTRRWS